MGVRDDVPLLIDDDAASDIVLLASGGALAAVNSDYSGPRLGGDIRNRAGLLDGKCCP